MLYQREQGRTVIKAVGEKAVESSRCAPLKANSASENEDRDVGELTWGDRWEYRRACLRSGFQVGAVAAANGLLLPGIIYSWCFIQRSLRLHRMQ